MEGKQVYDVLHILGNAPYEPGPSNDAHAGSATLYAPTWHDATTGDGAWSDASWCHDAWTNASAGKVVSLSVINKL